MAPAIAAGFAATIFMLVKTVVHMRKNPVPWAVYTSPFFFLIAATICTLSIVYKGSPNLGLNKKPAWYVAAVTMGVGGGVCLLAALFFVPFLHARVIKRDYTVKWWMFIYGPLLLSRQPPADAETHATNVPDYAVVQKEDDEISTTSDSLKDYDAKKPNADDEAIRTPEEEEKRIEGHAEAQVVSYKELKRQGDEKLHAKLRRSRGPIGWAMRTLHENPMGPGQIYERQNIKMAFKRLPAQIVAGLLYGFHYDIHTAQSGIAGTPDGDRMARVYSHAKKYPNETEHTYSFVQILTACTASFAHGANDIGNSVGPWAVIYGAWSTGEAAAAKAPVPVWQLAVLALWISIGLCTYGYNIMKGKLT
jgi:solute carrier family 20 (sodium-dependent phosphate transporter)